MGGETRPLVTKKKKQKAYDAVRKAQDYSKNFKDNDAEADKEEVSEAKVDAMATIDRIVKDKQAFVMLSWVARNIW